jgi:hypothetical protein
MEQATEMTFTFTEQEALTVLNVLAERPFKEVAGIVTKMQAQGEAQSKVTDS